MRCPTQRLACAFCGTHGLVAFVTSDRNRRVSDQAFTYNRCPACGLIWLANPPENLSRWYPSGYVSLPPSAQRLAQIARRTHYQIDLVRESVTAGRLLEIGPGFGSFAWLAKQVGFAVDVIEADAAACEYLTSQVGVTVTHSAAPERALASCTTRYDAVVLWHALEHLPDPWSVLRSVARILTPSGIVLIATPNPAAWQFGVLGRRWPHLDAPRHLWLIPLDVLRQFLLALGVEPISATSDDPGGRSWNQFGWAQTTRNLLPQRLCDTGLVRATSRIVGASVALLTSPWERRALAGSAYTAVFRRRLEAPGVDSGTLIGG